MTKPTLLLMLFAMGLISPAVATVAQAAPISFLGGTLVASLRLYDAVGTTTPSSLSTVLRREYVLGTDFFPGVPPTTLPYHAEIGTIQAGFPSASSGDGLAALSTGCSGTPLPGSFGEAYIIRRGDCTFDEKWSSLEAQRIRAGIMVNNVSTGIGPLGGITSIVTIPFFFVTAEVGAELLAGSSFTQDGVLIGRAYPILGMSVTWTPRVDEVPEPSTLTLALFGVLGIAFVQRLDRARRPGGATARREGDAGAE